MRGVPWLVWPVPPTTNHSHVVVGDGHRVRRVPTAKTRAFREEAGWLARQWAAETG